ncbi:MAG: sugar transferase [Proteobacteria bacterium]|nr:sugar transferase [Pseudomonadota bacterium]
MFKSKDQFFVIIHRIVDIIIVGLSLVLAFELRKRIPFFYPLKPFFGDFRDYTWHFLIVIFLWWHLLYFNRVYVSHRGKPVRKAILAVLKANVQGLLLLGFISFFLKEYWIHRTLVVIFFVICSILLILQKLVLFRILGHIRKHDKNLKYALIIGTGNRARRILDLVRSSPEIGLRVVGVLGNNSSAVGKDFQGAPIIGLSKDLSKILHQRVIDEVIIAISMRYIKEIRKMLLECEQVGINARIMAQIYNPVKASICVDELLDTPFITFTTRPLHTNQLYFKTVIDSMVALTLAVCCLPVFLIIAVLIKLDSKGPVFFVQERAGLNGRRFLMYKFRSMFEGAELQRFQLEDRNEMTGPVFKIRVDPRITRAGRFLRRTSLDELPQLLNVLKGHMSLVGPRPLPVYESDKIVGLARRRLSMKPGMTGLWQVSGRSGIDFDRWMELDLEYIDNWSLWLDTIIFLKTIFVWLSAKGAR